MEVNQGNLDILFRTANTKFYTVLAAATEYAVSSGIVEVLPMSTLIQDFPWAARLPAMRQWVGPRQVNSVSNHSKRFAALPWELTFELLQEHFEFDQYATFQTNITYLATQAKKLIDHQTADFLKTNTSVGYDGKVLFAVDHPTTGGDVSASLPLGVPATQSNLALNSALSANTYAAARAAMRSQLGEDGKPLNIEPNVLAVPPQLEQIGKTILEADLIANAVANIPAGGGGGQNIVLNQSNVYKNTAKLVVIPELAGMPNNWWLFDTTKPVKPLGWGQLKAPVFTPMINPDSPLVFMERKLVYGSHAWGCLNETLWFLSYAGTSEAQYAHVG